MIHMRFVQAFLIPAFLFVSCGQPMVNPATDVVPTHQQRIVTVPITTNDTAASVAAKYSGTVIVFKPEIGLAIVGTDNQSTPAGATLENNVALLPSPSMQAQGWGGAWSGGWHTWAGGWTTWSGGWNAGTAASNLPSVPFENRMRFSIGNYVQAYALAKNFAAGIKVAVIDTGVDISHPMFQGHLAPQNEWRDYVDSDQNPSDVAGPAFGHGTGVAGLVLQLAPRATILPIRVLKSDGSGDVLSVIAAIDWAVDRGAKVINLSLGAIDDIAAFKKMVEFAAGKGVYVVASAGNQGLNKITYPAAYATGTQDAHIISVGSVDSTSLLSSFSNHDPSLEFAVPGDAMFSAFPNNQIAQYAGTSFAAPQLSGIIAVGLGETDAANADKMQQYLVSSANSLGINGAAGLETIYLPNFSRFLQKPSTWVASKTVLFVVGNTALNASDASVQAHLQKLGYKILLKSAAQSVTADATGKTLVMISSSVNPTDVGIKFRDVNVPVMLWEDGLYHNFGFSTQADHGFVIAQTEISLSNEQHPMQVGLVAGKWTTYSASNDVTWAKPQGDATIIATLANDTTKATIFVYEAGGKLLNGTAAARRVGFFAHDLTVDKFNWTGSFLFDEAVNYAVNGN